MRNKGIQFVGNPSRQRDALPAPPGASALIAAVYDDPLRRLRAAAGETCTNQPAFEALTT